MNLPPKPRPSDPSWIRKEKMRKRKEARERTRISSDHELSGERHRQPHRDKDISVKWTKGPDGALHVEPTRVSVATVSGYDISDEDWQEIWRDKSEEEEDGE